MSFCFIPGVYNFQCETIDSPCAEILPYNMTSYGLQTGLNPILLELFSTNESDCHPDYKYLVCASVYYDCGADDIVQLPCEEFCRDVLLTPECFRTGNRVDRFIIMQKCSQYPLALNSSQQLCRAGKKRVFK